MEKYREHNVFVEDIKDKLPSDVVEFCTECFKSQPAHFEFEDFPGGGGGIDLVCDVCGLPTYHDRAVLPDYLYVD